MILHNFTSTLCTKLNFTNLNKQWISWYHYFKHVFILLIVHVSNVFFDYRRTAHIFASKENMPFTMINHVKFLDIFSFQKASNTLPETNSSHLKHWGLFRWVSFWVPASCQVRTVSFRESIIYVTPWKFNIDPQILPSQRESSLPTIIFQGMKGRQHFWSWCSQVPHQGFTQWLGGISRVHC